MRMRTPIDGEELEQLRAKRNIRAEEDNLTQLCAAGCASEKRSAQIDELPSISDGFRSISESEFPNRHQLRARDPEILANPTEGKV